MTIEDAEKGRMSYPTRYDPYDVNGVDLDEITISPRFAVAQGRFCHTYHHDSIMCLWYGSIGKRADGSLKLRAVDSMTISGCNLATVPTERLKCDTLDKFLR